MRIPFKQFCSIALLFLSISIFCVGCGEKKEAPTPSVVSKKIAVDKTIGKADTSGKQMAGDSAEGAVKPDEQTKMPGARIYDPQQRLNPFAPVFGKKEKAAGSEKGSKRKRRIPQTPLERISLDQLKLVAIIRASSGNRALVEDTVGKGYIIKNGTYIGLNAGMVTQINANSVVVEEEVENLKGELVLQSTEIKLQKPAGE
jgi:type IV pilus assembly protein PilP